MLVNRETHAQNVGNIDRIARIVAGLALLSLPMFADRWRGVPLKAVLDKAGIHAGSRQVTFKRSRRAGPP